MHYYLVRITDDFVGLLGVRTEKRKSAYRFRSTKHAERVAKLTAAAFDTDKVRVVGPFKED